MKPNQENIYLQRLQNNKVVFCSYVLLRILVAVVLIKELYVHEYEKVFTCIKVLILFIVPELIEKKAKISFSPVMKITTLLFIFCAQILGEIEAFYVLIPGWDTCLHTLSGFLTAALGIALIEIFNRSDEVKVSLSPFYVVLMGVCFSMTVGVIWEFFEFGCDQLLGIDMQKDTIITSIHSILLDPQQGNTPYSIQNISQVMVDGKPLPVNGYIDIGLIDTMKDLFVNFIGAVVFAAITYIAMVKKYSSRIVQYFVPRQS